MRLFTAASVVLACTSAALGQNATFLSGLLQTLTSSGHTSLANAVTQLNSSAAGPSVLSQLSSGSPFILFAPSDSAFNSAPPNTTDPDVLTDIIAYHIVSGNFSNVSSTYTNVTLGRSIMNDPAVVQLEGGTHQVVAWATRADNKVHILNQPNDTTVTNTSNYENVSIYTIDHVLTIPESFALTVPADNSSLFAVQNVLNSVSVPYFNASTNQTTNTSLFEILNSGLHGFTLFAPNNTAIEAASSDLASLASNQSALIALFQNHLINGTSTYSPLLTGDNVTSAAGEPFTFGINATGQYVTSGNVTALIVQPDVLLPNGVIHVIDRVLLNTQGDPAAASSAASSASSAATQAASVTAPITPTASSVATQPTSTTTPTTTSSASSTATQTTSSSITPTSSSSASSVTTETTPTTTPISTTASPSSAPSPS